MANFSKDKARRIYLSLTDQKDLMGVPLADFQLVSALFFVIFLIFGIGFIGKLTVAALYAITLIVLKSVCAKDMYNLEILKNFLLKKRDKYDV